MVDPPATAGVMEVDTVVVMATHRASPRGGSRHVSPVRPILRRRHNAACPVCYTIPAIQQALESMDVDRKLFQVFSIGFTLITHPRKMSFQISFLLLKFLGVRPVARCSIGSK